MLFSYGNKMPLAALMLLGGFSFALPSAAGDGAVITSRVRQIGGQPVVVIDSATQAASGLKTISVQPVQRHAEFEAIGKVISIQSLLALRERYLVAQAELNGAKARLKQTGQSLKRQQELFRHGITAKRSLQEQEAQGSADQALVDAGHIRLMAIANEARLLWGNVLAEWVLSDQTKQLAEYLSGRKHLLQITLPTNRQLAGEVNTLFIQPSGKRSKARSAALISRSTQADNAMQGESYFFQVSGDGLRIGMKVSAWIPEPDLGQSGVVVPESALVWYMEQVYVYIKEAKETFGRRALKEFSVAPEGYFIKNGIIKPGEQVVTTGGQMLLSEELRGQIPDGD